MVYPFFFLKATGNPYLRLIFESGEVFLVKDCRIFLVFAF